MQQQSAPLFGKSYDYGYGRVGVLQEYLLTQADAERLLSARGEHEIAQAITELKLSTHVEYTSNPHRFIHNIERWIQREARSMVPEADRQVFDILWLKDDASLLAYLLKKHHGLTSELSTEPHVISTAFDPDSIRSLGPEPGWPLRRSSWQAGAPSTSPSRCSPSCARRATRATSPRRRSTRAWRSTS